MHKTTFFVIDCIMIKIKWNNLVQLKKSKRTSHQCSVLCENFNLKLKLGQFLHDFF